MAYFMWKEDLLTHNVKYRFLLKYIKEDK